MKLGCHRLFWLKAESWDERVSAPHGERDTLSLLFCKCHEWGQQDLKGSGLVWVVFVSAQRCEPEKLGLIIKENMFCVKIQLPNTLCFAIENCLTRNLKRSLGIGTARGSVSATWWAYPHQDSGKGRDIGWKANACSTSGATLDIHK